MSHWNVSKQFFGELVTIYSKRVNAVNKEDYHLAPFIFQSITIYNRKTSECLRAERECQQLNSKPPLRR